VFLPVPNLSPIRQPAALPPRVNTRSFDSAKGLARESHPPLNMTMWKGPDSRRDAGAYTDLSAISRSPLRRVATVTLSRPADLDS
jgi:hypothetical protein